MAFPTIKVEIAWINNPFDDTPTWVDVSADLVSYYIKRGRQYEIDLFEAGQASITLLNHHGNYWPDNKDSTYATPSLLTGTAASGQKDVAVTDGSLFAAGQQGVLYDGTPQSEVCIIASIASNTLTMRDNLTNTYTVANDAVFWITNVTIGKRVKITATYSATAYIRYVGYIESITPVWGLEGLRDPRVELRCGDALSLIARYLLNNAGYASELSGTRITNVLDDVGFMAADRAIDTGAFTLQASGALANINALDHIKEVCTTEIGLFYIDKSGIATFEDKSHRTLAPHTTSQATFATNYPDIKISLDDYLLFNQVRATRTGGTEQVVDDATSQTKYRLHDLVKSGLLHTNDVITNVYAQSLLSRFKNPFTRAGSISILPTANPTVLFPYCLGFDYSTRITVTAPTPSGISTDFFIENIEENYNANDPGAWSFKWLLSNATQYLFTPAAYDITLAVQGNVQKQLTGVPIDTDNSFQNVDEIPIVDTDYNMAPFSTGTYEDRYGLAASSYTSGAINSVTIYYRVITGTGGTARRLVRIGTTNYYGAAKVPGDYTTYTDVLTVSPATSAAWTWSEITNMKVGIELVCGTATSWNRLTGIYIVVNVTPTW